MAGPLFRLIERRTGSNEGARAAISDVAYRLGIEGLPSMNEQLAGLALCLRGESVELVSKYLSWKDFEGFSSDMLRAKGYSVRENLLLKKPRAQIDVFAVSDRISLTIDCKHWARTPSHATLAKLVEAQKSRAKRLRDSLDNFSPMASVILVLVDGGERFVAGGAVVPIFALNDFLDNIEACRESLDWV
jgi:hypothetical protein